MLKMHVVLAGTICVFGSVSQGALIMGRPPASGVVALADNASVLSADAIGSSVINSGVTDVGFSLAFEGEIPEIALPTTADSAVILPSLSDGRYGNDVGTAALAGLAAGTDFLTFQTPGRLASPAASFDLVGAPAAPAPFPEPSALAVLGTAPLLLLGRSRRAGIK